MRNHEFFATRLEMETPAFVKVLRALPEDKLDYRPHERSTAAGDLAHQLAYEMGDLIELYASGIINFVPRQRPATLAEIVSEFEKNAEAALQSAKSTDPDTWKSPGKFLVNGNAVWEGTRADIAWGYLFDMVHHRGQLSSYIRPMGGKVPSIYGPSADER